MIRGEGVAGQVLVDGDGGARDSGDEKLGVRTTTQGISIKSFKIHASAV